MRLALGATTRCTGRADDQGALVISDSSPITARTFSDPECSEQSAIKPLTAPFRKPPGRHRRTGFGPPPRRAAPA